jgi:hypothetical protein
MMKVTFLMGDPDPKKHSTKFTFEEIDPTPTVPVEGVSSEAASKALTGTGYGSTAFYLPKPLFATAKRIRVTIEEVD